MASILEMYEAAITAGGLNGQPPTAGAPRYTLGGGADANNIYSYPGSYDINSVNHELTSGSTIYSEASVQGNGRGGRAN
jgi:hypothetical protein